MRCNVERWHASFDLMGATGNNRGNIQSIEVGFRLIRVLQKAGSRLTLKSLAEMAEMPSAKAHRYLVSFIRIGLVSQDPASQRYSLGPYAIELGLDAVRQIDLVEVARKSMQSLQDELRLPIFLSIWGNLGPAVVFKLDWNTLLPMTIKIGFVLPLLSTATGQIFLTYLPEAETEAALLRESGKDLDSGRIVALRENVRRSGLATSEGRLFAGFAAVSTGIFDHDNRIAAALTVLGNAGQIDLKASHPTASMLLATAGEISAALGNRNRLKAD